MKIALATFAAEAESGSEAAGVNPWVLGLMTFSVFVLLLLLTYSFRHTYHRHAANKPAR